MQEGHRNRNKYQRMKRTLKFENTAWKGFYLRAKVKREEKFGTIYALEISSHATAPEGDIILTEDFKNMRGCWGKSTVFKNFDELYAYITERYGKNNLKEFESVINETIEEMLKNRYVKEWKGRDKPL